MKRLPAVILAALLLTSLIGPELGLAGDVHPKTYRQNFLFTAIVMPNGDANITMKTIWLEPRDEIMRQIEEILNGTEGGNITVEEAIKRFEEEQLRRYLEGLRQAGMEVVNESLRAYGIEEGKNITIVFNAVAKHFATYYSYDDHWEVRVDPTRGYGSMAIPDTGFPFEIIMNNTFVVKLPPNSTVLSYPKPYVKQYNQSRFLVTSGVNGETVIVRSFIQLEPFLSPEGFKALFGDYDGYYIKYRAPYRGEERYERSVMKEYVTVDVYTNGTVRLHMRDEYIEPKEEVMQRKLEILSYGVDNVTQYILRTYSLALGFQGAIVEGGRVRILGLNETDAPLVIDAEYLVRNFTRYENGSYVYSFDPTMGIADRLEGNLQYEVNHTLYLTLNLPRGSEILEVPDNVTDELKGNRFTMTVLRNATSVRVVSNVFLRYGAPAEDVKALLLKHENATISYTLPAEDGSGLSGTQKTAAVIIAILLIVGALVIWRRR